jgi:hypothetical protein
LNLVRNLFPIIAVVFLGLGLLRLLRDGGKSHPQSRAWLLTGTIFALVSAWLWLGPHS